MKNEINQSWFFSQSPEEVWEYLTKPELLERWLGKTDFRPIVGHKFQFASPYGNHSQCEVLEVRPFTRLAYSWQKRSLKDDKPYNSTVAWTLVPKENGTELQLVHGGFAAMEDLTGHENGWKDCVQKIEKLINAIKA
jgi:uncharacterized protein YndB with AHSA1/START domain